MELGHHHSPNLQKNLVSHICCGDKSSLALGFPSIVQLSLSAEKRTLGLTAFKSPIFFLFPKNLVTRLYLAVPHCKDWSLEAPHPQKHGLGKRLGKQDFLGCVMQRSRELD